jgi:hypothetical protein|tara:strand:- start:907 stop:1320 length:414 start_codon:yes stop_codon:yes gene_type:complete
MKPESKLWREVKENLPNIFWTRFENWASPGVPDVLGIKDGIPFFVELKVIRSNKINLSPHQIMWNYKYSLKGGRSFIMAQALSQRLLHIFPGFLVHSIASEGILAAPRWTFPMDPASWHGIQELFLHSPLPSPPAQQ